MTNRQRAALLDLTRAALACRSATPDLRFRAQNLQDHLAGRREAAAAVTIVVQV